MPLLQVIVLGIVQGLTEFLPISSTAHLVVIPKLFGWPDQGLAFDIALHVGTLAAVLLYFFRDWIQILAQGFGVRIGGDPVLERNRKLLWLLVAGTIPAGIAGLLFQKQAETLWRENLYVIAGTAIGFALVMWFADYSGRKQKDIGHISALDSVAIGLAQAIAVVPGVSRSGITISAGLLRNLDRRTAARFSFLLSTPIIAGAAAKDLWDLMRHQGGVSSDMRTAFIVGIVVSAITGCLAIRFILEYLRRSSLTVFVIYRIVFGIIVIALATFLPAKRGMKYLGPTPHPRLNEAVAFVFLFAGLFIFVSLVSYQPLDPSWNTAAGPAKAINLTGRVGAFLADFLLQTLGLAAFAIPVLILLLGWNWIRSSPIEAPWAKILGGITLVLATCTALGLGPTWRPIANAILAGGLIGSLASDYLLASMNLTGAALFTAACWIVSVYLVSRFEMSRVAVWFRGPVAFLTRLRDGWIAWRAERVRLAKERAEKRVERRKAAALAAASGSRRVKGDPPIVDPLEPQETVQRAAAIEDIPIRTLEFSSEFVSPGAQEPDEAPPVPALTKRSKLPAPSKPRSQFRLPPTTLLQEPAARSAYDSLELKEIAARIKAKFQEFNVLGSVVQINPGPVVTTFEFKPEAGVKYSRITTLSEDLCLGLQAESILIERIPGKPTVGIEVPNSKREVISLRQILESEEFRDSASPLTVALGKDINGRIKIAALDAMPHMLIAGSTGSGKSVMLNSLIMSILSKATPHEVRMIMVDPKRLEFGLYEGIPHLLTPVITDAKKATNALRNAVLEMERRLKLLASQGVRNIDQYNRKVRQLQDQPRNLFEEDPAEEELEPIPYVLIIIDELADLMMLERANVEESVTRLAQMARAVGMHLVLATQRPSVDVITGLIKANFPSRISFRVATRVDSRTVLDVMGAEHLLGKGDMLFLPPGSSRLIRVHGAYVSEAETNRIVEFWKQQAEPEYDKTFLLPPPDIDTEGEAEEFDGTEDPMYQEAVRIVLEMGKASTSTLQRRLRLGYGRAARILDMMQREGIIGPPDGSRPREVLKRPDWLQEVESQLR